MQNWTSDEVKLAAIYGTCDFCGGPRDVQETHTFDAGRGVLEACQALVCVRCDREAT